MSNNLIKVERNLKSIAKRYRTVKYSLGLAILFLMIGTNAFTEEVVTRQTIQNSVGSLQTKINTLRSENEKQLKGLRLELVQLMEQGDQVIKSPWSSWQFGMAYSYSKWSGKYKGRSDKESNRELNQIFQRDTTLARYQANTSSASNMKYGITDLAMVTEPNVEIEVSAGIVPKNVNKTAPSYTPIAPAGALPPFEPRFILPPGKPTAPAEVSPTNFEPPSLPFIGRGFYQYWAIGSYQNEKYSGKTHGVPSSIAPDVNTWGIDTSVVIENYENYKTDATHTAANPFDIVTGNGEYKGQWISGGVKWMGKLKAWTTDGENEAIGGTPARHFNFDETLTSGSITGARSAFINELRDHNSVIEGHYRMTYLGGNPTTIPKYSYTKTFLSYNPAGRNVHERGTVSMISGFNDWLGQSKKRTVEFKGTLELNGSTNTNYHVDPDGNHLYEVLVGVEHQLWDFQDNKDGYSNFINNGDIILKSGNHVVGIMIDVESSNSLGRLKKQNNTTVNNGRIIIENKNSIGIDFGKYENHPHIPLDVTVGNIIIKGENNYGLRMKNIFGWEYYDDVTISGGAGKTVTVGGKHNVGFAIGKSFSSFSNKASFTFPGNLNYGVLDESNPISNFFGINVNVIGEESVGFLRLKDYSNNNTNDMTFNDQTMGVFTFGSGAKNSTLIRTDKYGIKVKKDITSTVGTDGKDYIGVGNTVLHSNGEAQHIYNYNTITMGKGLTQTVGMAATGNATSTITNILNEGSISLLGKKSIGMYVDKFTKGKSTGTIKLTGIGEVAKDGTVGDAENVGISNKGKFTFSGTLEVNGKKSSGIYNTGETTIEVGTNPTDRTKITVSNGTTALYSKGSGTKITSSAGNKLDITVNAGTTKEGLAVYAEDKSQVTLHNANINVNGGSAGVASYDEGTNIDLEGATLKYNGNGYAVYSDGKGKINLTNSNIELRGNSTLMDIDLNILVGNRPITTTNTDVKIFSNDVTAINVNNLGIKNISDLSGIKTKLGVNISAGVEGGKTFNKYKELAVENGEINFNIAVDKAEADTSAGGFFFKKVLGQRLKLNINNNVTAKLTSAIANEFYNGQVVGIEANSSSKATSNTETQVNVAAGKTIDAARTDSGSGAVGAFVNYGQVDNKGTINVEKDFVANSNAVGVYAVNGSDVTNSGTINVSGKDSIGVLGVAYRTDSKGNNVVDEFGKSATGQGKVNILNKGNINLDGQGATGIFAKNNKVGATLTNAIATNDTTGKITTTGIKAVGMSGEKANIINRGIINVNGQEGTGIFAKSSSRIENFGTINIVASTSTSKPNIGMFTEDQNTEIHNNKDIIGGNNTYGIYGKTINMGTNGKIKVGNNSVGIYSNGQYSTSATPNITLTSGSIIEVGKNEAVGVFATGKNQNISSQADMKIGDNSYGYVLRGTGTKLTTNSTNPVTVGNDTVFAYSTDRTGTIENRVALTSTGSKNYGIYAAGTSTNLGDINFISGVGNVGIYSIAGGKAINGNTTIKPTIRVSGSDTQNKFYGIGMAAGYTDDDGIVHQTGTVENYGTIKVEKENGIGMYATGSGSKAINRGTIELSGRSTTGMYLDNNAIGENYGTIKTVPNATNDGIIGVAALNGAIIKNYGTIKIEHGTNLTGIYLAKGKYDPSSTGTVIGGINEKQQSDTGKKVAGIEIKAPGNGTAVIKRNGKVVIPTLVDTTIPSPNSSKVRVGSTELDLKAAGLNDLPSISRASEIGMYIDTSGVNYTNPIKGLEKLTALKKVNLIFGTEATRYTNSKEIEIGKNILQPYNQMISTISTGGGKKFTINSAALTWIATGTQNKDDTFKSVYLIKIPYTAFAKDSDTYNFMTGLEEKYNSAIGKDKEIFNKINGIGKGEAHIFAQAVDEMRGKQYANIQQRVNTTGNILDKEFKNLRTEKNMSKDSNKIKTFGAKGEYKTDTAGIVDYKYNAYGVAYVHENEDIKLGKGIGWYTGIVHNKFKFKDIGKSKEEQLQTKLGIFKSRPYDDNNSLNWTTSAEIFVGYNRMDRKFLVVDEIYQAKSKYYTYGIGIRNEVSKEYRLSEDSRLKPYAALKLEYGRVSKIKEKNGEIKLEVKSNDYISIKPEIGTELAYRHYFGVKTLNTSIGIAYENELGKVANGKNKAKVSDTNADWFNIRGEKEDRKGNVKFDLNVGLDNQRFGVTGNIGYDTKGSNLRGGLGLRVIF